jgi:hypothetical protein
MFASSPVSEAAFSSRRRMQQFQVVILIGLGKYLRREIAETGLAVVIP